MDQGDRPVFALATTTSCAHQAIALAHSIAHDRHSLLRIVAAEPERITVSSARANVHGLAIDDWDPDPPPPPDLIAAMPEHTGVTVVPSMTASSLSAVIPTGATVVLVGSVGRFLKSAAERLAARLTDAGYDVVFVVRAACLAAR